MNKLPYMLCAAVGAIFLLQLPAGCSCGFDCSSNNNNNGGNSSVSLTLGFSDSLPEELTEVVIKVDSMTFRRSGANDVVINSFTISEQGLTNASDFQVDLLDYPGASQLIVLQNFRLDPALYTEVFIDVIVVSNSDSYVTLADGTQQALDVANGRLVLKDLQLDAGTQAFTVEFELAQSLEFDQETGYTMTTNGIRLVDNESAASLSGTVDSTLLEGASACVAKTNPAVGNRVYLYSGSGVEGSRMGDVFNSDSMETPPAGTLAPFAVAAVEDSDDSGVYRYAFGFLPPGSYTLGFSCNTELDDSVAWDDLDIPLPDNQIYQIELSEAEDAQCNLTTTPPEGPC